MVDQFFGDHELLKKTAESKSGPYYRYTSNDNPGIRYLFIIFSSPDLLLLPHGYRL